MLSDYENVNEQDIEAVQGIISFAENQIAKGEKICGRVCSLSNEHIKRIYDNANIEAKNYLEKTRHIIK